MRVMLRAPAQPQHTLRTLATHVQVLTVGKAVVLVSLAPGAVPPRARQRCHAVDQLPHRDQLPLLLLLRLRQLPRPLELRPGPAQPARRHGHSVGAGGGGDAAALRGGRRRRLTRRAGGGAAKLLLRMLLVCVGGGRGQACWHCTAPPARNQLACHTHPPRTGDGRGTTPAGMDVATLPGLPGTVNRSSLVSRLLRAAALAVASAATSSFSGEAGAARAAAAAGGAAFAGEHPEGRRLRKENMLGSG